MQAKNLTNKLINNFDIIYCSTSLRTRQTLEILLKNGFQSLKGIRYDERLREISLGIFERKNYSELSEDEKNKLKKVFKEENYIEHGGESINDLDKRLSLTWRQIQGEALNNNYKDILIISHGVAIARLLHPMKIKVGTKDIPNASGFCIEFSNDTFTIQTMIKSD